MTRGGTLDKKNSDDYEQKWYNGHQKKSGLKMKKEEGEGPQRLIEGGTKTNEDPIQDCLVGSTVNRR